MSVHVNETYCHFIYLFYVNGNAKIIVYAVRSMRGQKMAVHSTQVQNRALRRTQGEGVSPSLLRSELNGDGRFKLLAQHCSSASCCCT